MDNHVEIHTGGPRAFELKNAILLYSDSGRAHGDSYATLHAIERGKGGSVLGAGVPATKESCADFVRAIGNQSAFAGFLSPELLYISPRTVAWWRVPAPARVWFECTDAADKRKHLKGSAITPHPGLVFVLAGESWFVYAVKGSSRPTADTRLYRAPYMNVWGNNHICEGNIERPKRVTPETIAKFERAFFDSKFTHPNDTGHTKFKGGIYALWRHLLTCKRVNFPDATLKPIAKLNLAECIRQHESRKHADD